jgi:predicted nucleotidyltransferase
MADNVDEVILALSQEFSKTFADFRGIYLFGVFLDGKMHEDEDIELVAIFDAEDKSKREQIWPIIGKTETDLNVCIDLYPYTMDEFKADEEIYDEVMAEGVFYHKTGAKSSV